MAKSTRRALITRIAAPDGVYLADSAAWQCGA